MNTSKVLNVLLAASLLLLIIKSSFTGRSGEESITHAVDTETSALQTIFERKSVRAYQEKEVEEEQIERLLKAAMAAPSGRDLRPWHFIVVKDKQMLDKLGSEMSSNASVLTETRQAIIVCGDEQKAPNWYLDCAAATQNILLAAESLGLGAVWLGVYPYTDRVKIVTEAMNLPENILPLSIVSFGYPKAPQPPKDKYDSSRIHREVFLKE